MPPVLLGKSHEARTLVPDIDVWTGGETWDGAEAISIAVTGDGVVLQP